MRSYLVAQLLLNWTVLNAQDFIDSTFREGVFPLEQNIQLTLATSPPLPPWLVDRLRTGALALRWPTGDLIPLDSLGRYSIPARLAIPGYHTLELVDRSNDRTISYSSQIPALFKGASPSTIALAAYNSKTNRHLRAFAAEASLYDLMSGSILANFAPDSNSIVAGVSSDAASIWTTEAQNSKSIRRVSLPGREVDWELELPPEAQPFRMTKIIAHPSDPDFILVIGLDRINSPSLRAYSRTATQRPVLERFLVRSESAVAFDESGTFYFEVSDGLSRCTWNRSTSQLNCSRLTTAPQSLRFLTGNWFISETGRLIDLEGKLQSRSLPSTNYFHVPNSKLVLSQSETAGWSLYDSTTFELIGNIDFSAGFSPGTFPVDWESFPWFTQSFPGLRPAPSFTSQSLVHAASLRTTPLSPGLIVSLYGTNLGPIEATGPFWQSPSRISTWARKTQVFFDGVAAPILYASRNQINFIVPESVAGRPTALMQVRYAGVASKPVSFPVSTAAPALFSRLVNSLDYAIALTPSGQLADPARPLQKGSYGVFFGTGFGLPQGLESADLALRPASITTPVSATIGGRPAKVLYLGASPGQTSALQQINIEIPADSPAGNAVPVELRISGQTTRFLVVSIQ